MNPTTVDDLDFSDVNLIELPVKYKDKLLTLKEADGGASITYRNAMMKATKIGENGKVSSMEALADTEALLVSLCLFDGVKPVTITYVRSMPTRVMKALYEKIKKISAISESDDESEGALLTLLAKTQKKLDTLRKGKSDDPKASPAPSTAGSE